MPAQNNPPPPRRPQQEGEDGNKFPADSKAALDSHEEANFRRLTEAAEHARNELRQKEAEAFASALRPERPTEAKAVQWQYDETTSQLTRWMEAKWYLHSWQIHTNANGNLIFLGILVK